MNSALAAASPPSMIVQSDLLGTLEVAPEEMIFFPGGLFGFPECRMFVLVQAARSGMFWLQSTDHGTLAFLLADPFLFCDDYSVELTVAERAELQVAEPGDVVILSIITLPPTRSEQPTANLQGPVAINLETRRARQLALADAAFGTRYPVDLSRLG